MYFRKAKYKLFRYRIAKKLTAIQASHASSQPVSSIFPNEHPVPLFPLNVPYLESLISILKSNFSCSIQVT